MPRFHKFYDNCKIYFKNGEFSAYVSRNKIEWFLEKGLADRIDNDSIKLHMDIEKPTCKNRLMFPTVLARNNECVICGGTDDMKKFSVVGFDFTARSILNETTMSSI